MKAMIFAAGLGTRLRPLTDSCPKALMSINGLPLLELVIRRLERAGVREIIINAHHFADRIVEFVHQRKSSATALHVSDERDLLRDTGGGLKHAAQFFNDNTPFFAHNVDVISDVDLSALYRYHCAQPDALATLCVLDRPSSRKLLFDASGALCGWEHRGRGEQKISRMPADGIWRAFAFSGIHVISPELFMYMPEQPVFSIIDVYLSAASTRRILAYQHDQENWFDIGTSERLAQAAQYVHHEEKPDITGDAASEPDSSEQKC
ncbi:nucleotidyl transferase [Candidatus Moduliflexus flocculans]|uniref:Nucleotidyl transferase n=1 Tax=Candidatus Moduliflexus flocculans TaxID=1499966 RepID=A0A081BNV8_9BACT|nr:nucleotidyl transferase [Candidatus Moduliflexus flocculans]